MKRLVIVLILLACATAVYAHGTDYTRLPADGAVALQFTYSSEEPMAFAEIKVYSPGSGTAESILGYADRNGVYSFIPDEDGEWRVEAADGMGHKITAPISVHLRGYDVQPERKSTAGASLPLRVAFGLSLIVNIFALYWVFNRRKGRA